MRRLCPSRNRKPPRRSPGRLSCRPRGVDTTQHTTDGDVQRGPTGRSASVAGGIRGALLGLILVSCAVSAGEAAEGPLPGALSPRDAGWSCACDPTAQTMRPNRPCRVGLSGAAGAQLFCRPCPLCLPAGEGAQVYPRPCPCGLPDGTGAQLFCRPCPLCLPAGEGAQLFCRPCPVGIPAGEGAQFFHRPCPWSFPDGTGAQLYRRPCGLCLPDGQGAELFPRHRPSGPRRSGACPPP
jgi:hypothetical protein